MAKNESARATVMRSLIAVGSQREASFYANIFQNIAPEQFALIIIDTKCLKSPLFEALITDLKILSNLDLTPILMVGALQADKSNVRFQSGRLCQALDSAKIKTTKLNCASYQFMSEVKKKARSGHFVILEMTELERGLGLKDIANRLEPSKMIFLQPSGGFRVDDKRLAVVNVDRPENYPDTDMLSEGQKQFVSTVSDLVGSAQYRCNYVIVSPLNLLTELFTISGAGTMLRRGAKLKCQKSYAGLDMEALGTSIEGAFERTLQADYLRRPISQICIEENYRGGAIITQLADLPYLSKFWISQEAQGEGIARDIWRELREKTPVFFWRSKNDNTFNTWYMKMCEGMQVRGDWRVFWIGLDAPEIPDAVLAASNAPQDFVEQKNNSEGWQYANYTKF